MPDSFDAYFKWLGIPPKDQPPHHYRLLGLELLESDLEVISHAAERQMLLVRTFQAGKHSEWSQRLLNEISTARVCLLDQERKSEYDESLRRELQGFGPPPLPTFGNSAGVKSPPMPPPRSSEVSTAPPAHIAEPPLAPESTTAPVLELSEKSPSQRFNWGSLGVLLGVLCITLIVVLVSLQMGGLGLGSSDGGRLVTPGESWSTGYADVRVTTTCPIGELGIGQSISPDLPHAIETLDAQLLGLHFTQDDGSHSIRFVVQQSGFVVLLVSSRARATSRLQRLGWEKTDQQMGVRSGGTITSYDVFRREVRQGEVHTLPKLSNQPRLLACNELPMEDGG